MKIRADEHVSISIVEAIRTIALSDSHILDHVIEAGQRGFGDVQLDNSLCQRRRKSNPECGYRLFLRTSASASRFSNWYESHISPTSMADGWLSGLQAAHVLHWCERIEQQLDAMKPRECFKRQWNVTEEGKLIKVPIDFAKADKQAKRERKRAIPEVC